MVKVVIVTLLFHPGSVYEQSGHCRDPWPSEQRMLVLHQCFSFIHDSQVSEFGLYSHINNIAVDVPDD